MNQIHVSTWMVLGNELRENQQAEELTTVSVLLFSSREVLRMGKFSSEIQILKRGKISSEAQKTEGCLQCRY